MTQCLNPDCLAINLDHYKFCQKCGKPLWLKDRYQALKLIGQGGFGKTFLAIDHDKPSKPRCVIKQFFPQMEGTGGLAKAEELFSEEAKRLDELGHHDQIPSLFAYFTIDNQQYLVQEYIEGENLEECLAKDGAWTEAEIHQLLVEILEILRFVHEKNIIHRDIKPENIIRKLIEGRYKYVLVDFGAARQFSGESIMRTGTIIGDPRYMADEQIQGKATFGSDIYSLGLTCLHLLTNIDPWSLFDSSEGKWVWKDYLIQNIDTNLAEIFNGMICKPSKYRLKNAEKILNLLNRNINNLEEFENKFRLGVSKTKDENSENESILIQEIDTLLESGQYDNVLSLCEINLKDDPHNELILHRKGRSLLELNKYDEATFVFEEILSLNSSSIPDLYFYSYALYYSENYELALDVINRAIGISPDDTFLYHTLAQIYFSQTKYRDAIDTYSKIIDLTPEDDNAWYGKEISSLYLSQNNNQIEAYEKAPQEYFQDLQRFEKNGKWGFRNSLNRVHISPRFDDALDFSNGLAAVKIGKRWGFINYVGHVIINTQFKEVGIFSEGLAFIKSGKKFGYINRNGKTVIPAKFFGVDTFIDGLAAVQTDIGFRYINKYGDFWGDFFFEEATSFWGGVSTISINKKYGCMNMDGDFTIEPSFEWLGCFSEGLAPFKIKQKIGFVDMNGNIAISPQFDEVSHFNQGVSKVKFSNSWIQSEGSINKYGDWIKKERKLNPNTLPYIFIPLVALHTSEVVTFSVFILIIVLVIGLCIVLEKLRF